MINFFNYTYLLTVKISQFFVHIASNGNNNTFDTFIIIIKLKFYFTIFLITLIAYINHNDVFIIRICNNTKILDKYFFYFYNINILLCETVFIAINKNKCLKTIFN